MNKKMAIVVVALIAALSSTIAMAAWTLNRPVNFGGTIVVSDNFQVFSDSACTQVLTTFSLGDSIHHGDVISHEFWIKNTGEAQINLLWNVTGAPAGITFSMGSIVAGNVWPVPPDSPAPSHIGDIWDYNMTVTIGSSVATGPFTCVLNVYGTA